MASPPQAPNLLQRAEDFLHAAYGSLTESDRSKLPPLERALADPKFYSFSPSDQAWALSKLSPEFDAFSDKDKQYAVTQLNARWKAKHPPLLSRIETSVAGPNTLLGKEGKSTVEQIFAPALLGVEAAIHPNTPVVNLGELTSGPGATRGALNAVSGLTTPINIALMSGGVGALDSVAEKLIGKYGPRAIRALIDAGFARNLLKQGGDAGNQVEALYKAGKPDEARQALANFLASAGFGTVAGVSALNNAFGDLFPAPRAPKPEEPKTINVKARVEEAPKAQPQAAAPPTKGPVAREPENTPAAPIAPSEIFSAHDFKVVKSDKGNTVTFKVKSSTGKALGPAKVLIQPDGTAVVETKPEPVSEESIRQRALFHLQKKQAKQPPKAPVVKAPEVEAKPEAPETVSPVPESVAKVPETAVAPKEEPKLEPAVEKPKSAALQATEQAPAGTVVYFWNLPDTIKGMTGPWEKLPDGAWRNNQHGQLATSQSVADAIEKSPQTHQITAPQTEHIEALGIQPLRETPVAVTPEAVSSTTEEPKASITLPEKEERKEQAIAPQEQAAVEQILGHTPLAVVRTTGEKGTPGREEIENKVKEAEKEHLELQAKRSELEKERNTSRFGTKKHEALDKKVKDISQKEGEAWRRYEALRTVWRQGRLEDAALQTENPLASIAAQYELVGRHAKTAEQRDAGYKEAKERISNELRSMLPQAEPSHEDDVSIRDYLSPEENETATNEAVADVANRFIEDPLLAEKPERITKELNGAIRVSRIRAARNKGEAEINKLEKWADSKGAKISLSVSRNNVRLGYSAKEIQNDIAKAKEKAERAVEEHEKEKQAKEKGDVEFLASLKPVESSPVPGIRDRAAWGGNVAEGGEIATDGHIALVLSAIKNAGRRAKIADAVGSGRTVSGERVSQMFHQVVGSDLSPLTAVGHGEYNGADVALYLDPKGEVHALMTKQVRLVQSLMEANEIRGGKVAEPVVFYHDKQPVAILMPMNREYPAPTKDGKWYRFGSNAVIPATSTEPAVRLEPEGANTKIAVGNKNYRIIRDEGGAGYQIFEGKRYVGQSEGPDDAREKVLADADKGCK